MLAEADLRTAEQFNNMILVENRGYPAPARRGAARLGALDERSIIRRNGQPGLGMGVVKQSTANSLSVAQAVKQEIARIQPSRPTA